MKKFRITAIFNYIEKITVIEAMDESMALDKWGIDNQFKYEYVTNVEELKYNNEEESDSYLDEPDDDEIDKMLERLSGRKVLCFKKKEVKWKKLINILFNLFCKKDMKTYSVTEEDDNVDEEDYENYPFYEDLLKSEGNMTYNMSLNKKN